MKTEKETEKQPDVNRLSGQLAGDNDRVACFVHGLMTHVDQLVAASQENDWQEVRRVSEFLMRSSPVYGLPELARRAELVCRALEDPTNIVEIKRSLVRLVGKCGSIGQRRTTANRES